MFFLQIKLDGYAGRWTNITGFQFLSYQMAARRASLIEAKNLRHGAECSVRVVDDNGDVVIPKDYSAYLKRRERGEP